MFRCNGSKLSQPTSQPPNQSARRANERTDGRTDRHTGKIQLPASRHTASSISNSQRNSVFSLSACVCSLARWNPVYQSCIVKRGIPPLVTAKVVTTRLTGSAPTRTCSQIIPGICIITRTLQDRGFAGTRFPIFMGPSLNCDGSRRFHLAEACTVFGCSISHRRVFHWRAGQGWLFASSSAWFTPFFRSRSTFFSVKVHVTRTWFAVCVYRAWLLLFYRRHMEDWLRRRNRPEW